MAQRDRSREGSKGEKEVAGDVTRTGDDQGQEGDRGERVGNYSPHTKREGGVQGHWDSRDVVEGVLSGG